MTGRVRKGGEERVISDGSLVVMTENKHSFYIKLIIKLIKMLDHTWLTAYSWQMIILEALKG